MKHIHLIILLFALIFGLFACVSSPSEPTEKTEPTDVDCALNPFDPSCIVDIPQGKDYEVLFSGDWNTPGLKNKDGSDHIMPEPVEKTGITLNVTDFGAIANNPSFNNFQPFRDAIDAALPGDEVFVPAGTYFFTGSRNVEQYYTHIDLKSGIIFNGAGEDQTFLVSQFSESSNQNRETTLISIINAKNIRISNMTLTSNTLDSALPDPNNSGLQSGVFTAPKYMISIDSPRITTSFADQSHNILIEQVTIEKFQRMGVRLRLSREVTINEVTFQKAVNLGGGGAGYGVSIQGSGYNTDWTGTTKDTVWNVIRNSRFIGPYLRHGALIQYHAHNNLIEHNYFVDNLLDAIDMHGEDEYSNEIRYNDIINTRQGAGVGVGNSGATHDAAGRNNYIHHNTIDGGLRGIDVILGSPRTIIANNTIKNLTQERSIGITLSNAPNTYVLNNTLENINGSREGYGIKITYSFNALNPELGVPKNIMIKYNAFNQVRRGIFVETYGDNFIIEENTFTNIIQYDYLSTKETFIIPARSALMDPVIGYELLPIDINFITTEDPNGVQSQKNMKFKSSINEPQFNRMIYAKFDLGDIQSYNKVYLSFSAKAQVGMPTINIWGSTSYTNWTTNTITWNNSRLHEPSIAKTLYDPDIDNLTKIIDFKFPIAVYEFNTYYIDITAYIESLNAQIFTMVLSNDDIEEVYMEIYNHLQTASNQHFRLIFT